MRNFPAWFLSSVTGKFCETSPPLVLCNRPQQVRYPEFSKFVLHFTRDKVAFDTVQWCLADLHHFVDASTVCDGRDGINAC